jgi:hypothetical protein
MKFIKKCNGAIQKKNTYEISFSVSAHGRVERGIRLQLTLVHFQLFILSSLYKKKLSLDEFWLLASGSFAGLSFLAWYQAGKTRAFDRKGHVAKLCIVFSPILLASLVGVSRVDDYLHHWQDVFAAGLLGLFVKDYFFLFFWFSAELFVGNTLSVAS